MKRVYLGPPPGADSAAADSRWEKAHQRYHAIAAIVPGDPQYVPGRTYAEQVRILQKEGHPLHPSIQNLSAWKIAFIKGDWKVQALLDGQRGGKGQFRGWMGDPENQDLVSRCERQIIATSHLMYPPATVLRAKVIAAVGAKRAKEIPSAKTLDCFRRQAIEAGERKFLAEGERAFDAAMSLKKPSDFGGRHGDVLIIDHKKSDVFVWWGDRPIRSWFSTAVDPVSGACRGFVISPTHPGSAEVALALRDAIREKPEDPDHLLCGLPETLYMDRGRDMRSHHIEAVIHDLGIGRVLATGHSPWARGSIEGNLHSMLSRTYELTVPGYVGNSPKGRPPDVKAALQFQDYAAQVRRWALVDFNRAIYQKKRLPDGSRGSRLDFARALQAPLRMPSDHALMLALLKRKQCTVEDTGISIGPFTYISETEEFVRLIERRAVVEVRYDPMDLGEVYVFREGTLICVLRNEKAAGIQATEQDKRQYYKLRGEQKKHYRELTRRDLEAAQDPDAFLERLAEERAAELPAVAGGGRPRAVVRQLLPTDRAARQISRPRSGSPSPPRPLRRATGSEWDPWSKPLSQETRK